MTLVSLIITSWTRESTSLIEGLGVLSDVSPKASDPTVASTASRKVFDGMVPVRMQTPPRDGMRSTSATRRPILAA